MDNNLAIFAKELGIDTLELKFAIALFSVFPFGYIHRKMTNVTFKHCYSIIIGVFLGYFMFGLESLHYFFSTFVCYLIIKYVDYKVSPWIVFVLLIAHLSYGHIMRQLNNYLQFGLDWSLPQMIIVVKVSSLAWAYHDGQLPYESLDRPQRKEKRIQTLPSLLEYYSFIYFFAGFLTGPFTEFNYYISFTNRSTFKDNNGEIPSSWISTIGKLMLTLMAYVMTQIHKQVPDMYTTTDEFLNHSLGYRLLYILVCIELGTAKYYFAFSMGEAACNIVGISYNGKDSNGIAKWDRIVMARLWKFKTSTNTKGLVDHWNVPCQIWLKDYVFLRIILYLNNRVLGVFGTFFTSAFWHGFYGGYYCFFLSGAFFSYCGDVLTIHIPQYFYNENGTPKSAYHHIIFKFFAWTFTYITITYMAISFRLLSFTLAMKAWSSIYFFWHIFGLMTIVLLAIFPLKKQKKKKDQ